MSAWDCIAAEPFLFLLMVLMAVILVSSVWKHLMRTVRILVRGWPPLNCDADGERWSSSAGDENAEEEGGGS